MNKIILNLGCGRTALKNAINVDFSIHDCCDLKMDLSKFPWKWRNNSVDEIYMLYFLEHFDKDTVLAIFRECHRVLKTSGLIHIQVPHYTSTIALTDLSHKTAFNINSFDLLEGGNYMFSKPIFQKELIKINILETLIENNRYLNIDLDRTKILKSPHPFFRYFLHFPMIIFQFLIDLSPLVFERFWCYYIGGAGEIIYRGRKV